MKFDFKKNQDVSYTVKIPQQIYFELGNIARIEGVTTEEVINTFLKFGVNNYEPTEEKVELKPVPMPNPKFDPPTIPKIPEPVREHIMNEHKQFATKVPTNGRKIIDRAYVPAIEPAVAQKKYSVKAEAENMQLQWYCSNKNCPTKGQRHAKKEMVTFGLDLYCSNECALGSVGKESGEGAFRNNSL